MTFTLPFLPPTSNNAYINTRRGRVYGRALSAEARKWLADTALVMRSQMHGQALPSKTGSLGVFITLSGNWRTKAGKWRKTDLSNRIKLVEDCAMAVMGLDDSAVVAMTIRKILGPDKTIISVNYA